MGYPMDIDIRDYISFKHGNVIFTYPENDYGHEIYLTVASTVNRKTAYFVIIFPYG